MDKTTRMKTLVNLLNEAAKAYYQEDREIMANIEYDALYDELLALEKETGIVYGNSPSQHVGYEVLGELPKERHASAMLSLDKTKDREALAAWLGDNEGLLSWKLDGLTIVLTYEDGMLTKGITRGNGEIGEVITNNVKVFENVPLRIEDSGRTVVRGEAVIRYADFEKINESLSIEEKYKNPRNLCSGSVRQLNNEITAKRHVHFYAFQLVSHSHMAFELKSDQLTYLSQKGFEVVPYEKVTKETVVDKVDAFEKRIDQNEFASDGLVLTYDNIAYSQSLGSTSKFPKHSIAFKWQDEVSVTKLLAIEWSASRTGLINPVAIFEPVDLEGTTVTRASLHNVSILKELKLGLGDEIEVYKANMIIPQVARNLTGSDSVEIPSLCPVCQGETLIKEVKEVMSLYCQNPMCPAKQIKSFAHYVSRDAMNIDGMSEATIEKLIGAGVLHTLPDLYKIKEYQDVIENLEGFGEKSFQKLVQAIETSKLVRIENFIYALGIQNVGLSNAKVLCKQAGYDLNKILNMSFETLLAIDGYGEVIARSLVDFFGDVTKREMILELESNLTFETNEASTSNLTLEGLSFVVTGSVNRFDNRKALQEVIEKLGGKVIGSVSAKTDYLINNDVASTSGKNKKAMELKIPILSEDDFIEMIGGL